MSSRLRVLALVAGVAVLAAGAVVGITLATRQTPPGLDPLKDSPGVPTALPTKWASQIRTAFREWPHGSVDAMETLGEEHRDDPVVQFYLGLALVWAGYDADATAVLERVKSKNVGYDTPWEIQADNLLHPQYETDDPVFTYTGPDRLLARGSRLQAEGHQHSAEHEYLVAAEKDPGNVDAQVAAAVGRFDKDDLTPAFSHLGPLTQRFPRSPVVRYYLGLLLAWTDQQSAAVAQFKKAVALGKGTSFGTAAQTILTGIAKAEKVPVAK